MSETVEQGRARLLSSRTRPCLMAILLVVLGCQSDATEPGLDQGMVRATLVAPGPVTAVVLELQGALEVSFEDGLVFVQQNGSGLHVVLLLEQPGELTFAVLPADPGTEPVAAVIEVADEADRVPTSLDAYRVRFGA